jgi:hypothetical protein
MDSKTSGSACELDTAAVFNALSDELEAILNNDNESLDSDDEVKDIIEEIDLGESLDTLYWLGVFNHMYILLDKILSKVDLNNVKGFVLYMEENLSGNVMNMTFTRTDRRRSQLSIEPTHSQIGCLDQELSQLQGFSDIYICRNDEVLSTRIGARTDRNRCPESIPS